MDVWLDTEYFSAYCTGGQILNAFCRHVDHIYTSYLKAQLLICHSWGPLDIFSVHLVVDDLSAWKSSKSYFRTGNSCFMGMWNALVKVNPANICFFKVNNKKTRKSCETCSKLAINFVLVLLLLTLNIFYTFFYNN